jgi:hypothetical protein
MPGPESTTTSWSPASLPARRMRMATVPATAWRCRLVASSVAATPTSLRRASPKPSRSARAVTARRT